MRQKRTVFPQKRAGILFLLPALAILAWFFYWPAGAALVSSVYITDIWGQSRLFVGLETYGALLADPAWRKALRVTLVFAAGVTVLSIAGGVLLALAVDTLLRGRAAYRNALIWPFAISPVVAGAFWAFLTDPGVGVLTEYVLRPLGIAWDPALTGSHAMALVILAATWKQVSYNFIFFLAGLQGLPRAMIEAAAIDGAGPLRRIRDHILPVMSPFLFFLLVVNLSDAMFDSFALIHAITGGGPAGATGTLVYKVFRDGFLGQDIGAASAQSVLLLLIVVALTLANFRAVERRVHYR